VTAIHKSMGLCYEQCITGQQNLGGYCLVHRIQYCTAARTWFSYSSNTYITNNTGLVTAFVQSLNLFFEHYKWVLIQLFSENRFNYLNSKTNQPHSQAFPPPVLDCSQYAPLGDHVRKVIIILHFLLWHESFRVTWNYQCGCSSILLLRQWRYLLLSGYTWNIQ